MRQCDQVHAQLGLYVDGELPPAARSRLEAHLNECSACRFRLRELEQLAEGLRNLEQPAVPENLWAAVQRGLAQGRESRPAFQWFRGAKLATAATILFAVGVIWFAALNVDRTAQASEIDFTVLLDALRFDVDEAFARFVSRNNGKRTTSAKLQEYAPNLNFATPQELPGGFQLQEVYALRVGSNPGIAARYERNGEFLAAIFHPPVRREEFGSHKDHPCVIGKHRGHKVSVGEWKLVHVTDPTTCHCILSRLDEETELPAILRILAPEPRP
jgi:hypothetical protein